MIKADNLKWIIPSKEHSSISDNSKPCIRIIKAEEQYNMEPVDDEKIVELINEFLQSLNMPSVADPKVIPINRDIRRFNYSKIKEKYNLADKRDIVWLKFTKNKHHIGVVGTSCDINFNSNNTSGKIVSHLKESWDESYVFIFPLKNIPEGLNRSDIESGIGNYLIANNIPILDFYSHNY